MINNRHHILKITIFAVFSIIILAVFYISCGGGGGGGSLSWAGADSSAGQNGSGSNGANKLGSSSRTYHNGMGNNSDTIEEIYINGNPTLDVSGYTFNNTTYTDLVSLVKAIYEKGITEDIFYVDFTVQGESSPRRARIRANGAANSGDDLTIDYQYKATYRLPDSTPEEVFYYKRDGIPLNLPPLSSSEYTTPVNGIVYHANKYSVQGQVVSSGNVRINSSGDVSFDIMPTGDTTYGFRLSDNTLVVNQTSGTVVIDSTGQIFEKIELPASAADGSISLDLSSVSPLNLEGAPGTPDENNPGEYIPHPAITNGPKLGAVTLPATPFTIKTCAFQCCSNLTNVDLSNCTSIGEGAFDHCTSLTSVDLSNFTSIGDGAFQSSGLSGNLDLSNFTSVGQWVFKNCNGITSVSLSNSCTEIGWSAFEGCTGLTSIDLSSCTTIDQYAFRLCAGLGSVNLSSCTSIGEGAFELCTGLTDVTFSNDTSINIARRVFENASSSTTYHFPRDPHDFTYPDGTVFPDNVLASWDESGSPWTSNWSISSGGWIP